MSKEVNINLLLDRLYTTGKVDKKYIWALEHYITKLKQENERLKEENKLSQILETNVKKYKTHSIGYSTDDLDIVITFKEKQKRR